MRKFIHCTVLLAGALMITTGMARSQGTAASKAPAHKVTIDTGIAFTTEYARVVNQSCSCFWLKGVTGDMAVNFYRGLGVDVAIGDGIASNILPAVNLNKFTLTAGPRYTFDSSTWKRGKIPGHPERIFVQGLVGWTHGSNSVFPVPGGVTAVQDSIASQVGGGVDVPLKQGFGIRVAQVDWTHSALPNGSANVQNDLRLSFGVTYSIGRGK